MGMRRPLDTIWTVQLIAATRRLVAMAMWQEMNVSDEIEAFVQALDKVVLDWRPQTPRPLPVTKIARRALSYGIAPYGTKIAELVRPNLAYLHWQQNSNHAYTEFIGPDGISRTDHVRVGLLLMDKGTTYPFHTHPAAEIYFVMSGQGYFKKDDRPWRSSPANQFILHTPNQPHAIETRDQHLLALYIWRGDVKTMARLS